MGFWPYGELQPNAAKRSLVLILGIVVGCKLVTHYYNPTKEYEQKIADGKLELLKKYRKIHEERLKRCGNLETS
ncbi:Hypothetical protein SRAE_1000251400 [Strongyloides ratti]|uniref:ATP synthase subunit e, mitochondrial n=1 Tax=Strongyloides ratti TaxID=34506 RepID=A0A090MWT8_STRRB|nr:Hypothetical protein SRAE_1000251400 [Strongyloides ratti]CEF64259.1 Hypothetical protein SRAE_1000251400 [Strongyloides ratti]